MAPALDAKSGLCSGAAKARSQLRPPVRNAPSPLSQVGAYRPRRGARRRALRCHAGLKRSDRFRITHYQRKDEARPGAAEPGIPRHPRIVALEGLERFGCPRGEGTHETGLNLLCLLRRQALDLVKTTKPVCFGKRRVGITRPSSSFVSWHSLPSPVHQRER